MSSKLAGIVAPSGNVLNPDEISHAATLLEKNGWTVEIGTSVFNSYQRFGGNSDEERLKDFNQSLKKVNLVLAARGGYGLNRILSGIDYETIKERNVWVAGFSDITLFSLAYLALYGGKSLHAPTASVLGRKTVSSYTIDCFFNALNKKTVSVEFETESTDVEEKGILWGGNLSVLVSTLGTKYFPDIKNGILFVEDVAEPAYKIERALMQLHDSGILAQQKAILLGSFTGIRHSAHDFGYGLSEAIAYIRANTATPIIEGLPFGHSDNLCTLVVGAQSVITVNSNHCELIMDGSPGFTK